MKLRLRTIAQPKLSSLTAAQLKEVASNLIIEFDDNVHPVTFSPTAPTDTSIPWQPTDACGSVSIGRIKTFRNGEWV